MMEMKEVQDLVFKINPGGIDLYKATFGKEGILGELVAVIDKRVKEIFENRVRMGLPPIEQLDEKDDNLVLKQSRT